jgi:hypothetical protein
LRGKNSFLTLDPLPESIASTQRTVGDYGHHIRYQMFRELVQTLELDSAGGTAGYNDTPTTLSNRGWIVHKRIERVLLHLFSRNPQQFFPVEHRGKVYFTSSL